jgi:endo-1,4-beta-mannosidase
MREIADMGGNAVRIGAYQSFTAGGRDFSRLDLIMEEGNRNGVRVILTLENQWPDCTEGGYKDADWYRSGYDRPYGAYPLSYREYVARIVRRYRDEPAILMWQLMNEAESRTSMGFEDPSALLAFTTDMAELVRSIDRNHLLSLGTIGIGRDGSGGANYVFLHQVPGIDLAEGHDYHADRLSMSGEVRLSMLVARAIGIPFFIGEVGMDVPPLTREERALLIRDKLENAWNEGVDGILVWSYRAGDGGGKDFDQDDPLVSTLRDFSRSHRVRPAYH